VQTFVSGFGQAVTINPINMDPIESFSLNLTCSLLTVTWSCRVAADLGIAH